MKLSTTDFSNLYNRALAVFAEHTEEEMEGELYGIPRPDRAAKADRLLLYVYALNTWTNTDGAFNFITEQQMLQLISKIQNHGL